MKGSEKQIKWAEDIKAGVYNALGCMERNAIRFAENGLIENTLHYDIDDVNAVRELVVAQMESIEDAGTIISIRDNLTQRNLENMAKVHHKEEVA